MKAFSEAQPEVCLSVCVYLLVVYVPVFITTISYYLIRVFKGPAMIGHLCVTCSNSF